MPLAKLHIRPKAMLDIYYVGRRFHVQLEYLNIIRSGLTPSQNIELQYRNMEKWHAGTLARSLPPVAAGSVILTPPSSRTDAKAYLDAVLTHHPGLKNISTRMTRKGKVKAATAQSIGSVIREFDYNPQGDESAFKAVYILDETVGTGRTIASMLYHLCKAGLPKDCKVVVVTALWVDPQPASAEQQ
jgi:hypothetical protein